MLLRDYSKLPSSKVVGQNRTINLRWFWVNEVQNMFVHEREKRIYRRVILLLRRVNTNEPRKEMCGVKCYYVSVHTERGLI